MSNARYARNAHHPAHHTAHHKYPFRPVRWLCALVVVGAATWALSTSALAAPIPCGPASGSGGVSDPLGIQARANAKKVPISADEAATREAGEAARKCLSNVQRAMNQIAIPAVSFSVDFSGLLSGMINQACQVVTTQIDQAGRVINNTVSGAANRVVRDINDSLGLPPGYGAGTNVGGTVATPGFSGGGLGGSVGVPSPSQPGMMDRVFCTLTGNCP